MVDPDARLAAELAYQRALSALHDARAELADVSAARRRLAYERAGFVPGEADAAARALEARLAELDARTARLRGEATTLREALRRHLGAEPADLAADAGEGGFEQPPFPDGGH